MLPDLIVFDTGCLRILLTRNVPFKRLIRRELQNVDLIEDCLLALYALQLLLRCELSFVLRSLLVSGPSIDG